MTSTCWPDVDLHQRRAHVRAGVELGLGDARAGARAGAEGAAGRRAGDRPDDEAGPTIPPAAGAPPIAPTNFPSDAPRKLTRCPPAPRQRSSPPGPVGQDTPRRRRSRPWKPPTSHEMAAGGARPHRESPRPGGSSARRPEGPDLADRRGRRSGFPGTGRPTPGRSTRSGSGRRSPRACRRCRAAAACSESASR